MTQGKHRDTGTHGVPPDYELLRQGIDQAYHGATTLFVNRLERLFPLADPNRPLTPEAIRNWGRKNDGGRRGVPRKEGLVTAIVETLSVDVPGTPWSAEQAFTFAQATRASFEEVIGLRRFFGPSWDKLVAQAIVEVVDSQARPAHRRPYEALVGRDALVARTVYYLADRSWPLGVAFDGLGGIGKSASANESAIRAVEQGLFTGFITITATTPDGQPRAGLTAEALLNQLGAELGLAGFERQTAEGKRRQLRWTLEKQRLVILVDNLETASSLTEVVDTFLSLAGTSKFLFTSRQRFPKSRPELVVENLQALDGVSAIDLLRHEGERKGELGRWLVEADEAELAAIVKATGGVPLALHLVAGQIAAAQEPEQVLARLRTVTPLLDVDQDEYLAFYRHIYAPSWPTLLDESRQLLLTMARQSAGVPLSHRLMQRYCALPAEALERAIYQLWLLSFLEIARGAMGRRGTSEGTLGYYIHAITQHYVLADVVRPVTGSRHA